MDDRFQIYEMLHQGRRPKEIATALGVAPSTISRELERNRSQRGCRPHKAQEMAGERRQTPRRPSRLPPELRAPTAAKWREDWSPEQIAGRLKREGLPEVSHETIYLLVCADQRNGGDLHAHLRRGRAMIGQRPPAVQERPRLGDWEATPRWANRRVRPCSPRSSAAPVTPSSPSSPTGGRRP
jgi:IS30 family transposase